MGELGKTMRSLCMLSNNTAIVEVMSRINHKFDLMFSRRAFVHHFVGEGMDAGEFNEARESCAALERDYDGEKIEPEEEEDDRASGCFLLVSACERDSVGSPQVRGAPSVTNPRSHRD